MPETIEYTPSHRMIAAAIRLREAWKMPEPDIVEMHEAALGLILATGTSDLYAALDILHDVESEHGSRVI